MGAYEYSEHYRLFGGAPEPGEAYLPLDAVDDLRKERRESPCPSVHCPCVQCWDGDRDARLER